MVLLFLVAVALAHMLLARENTAHSTRSNFSKTILAQETDMLFSLQCFKAIIRKLWDSLLERISVSFTIETVTAMASTRRLSRLTLASGTMPHIGLR
jgi:hypothetical protein